MKSKDIIYLSLCIAAQDGLISDIEISRLFELLNKKIAKLSKKEFERHLRSFFSSKLNLEDCLSNFSDKKSTKDALSIAKECASADGLDIKENIAYQKALMYLNEGNKDA